MREAILKLDFMPEKCLTCVLSTKKQNDKWYCTAFGIKNEVDIYAEERMSFCPLVEVKED